MKSIMGACLVLVLWAAGAPAAEPVKSNDDDVIRGVATTALRAAQERQWDLYVDQFHPTAWQEFAEMLRPALAAAEQKGPENAAVILPLFADAKSVGEVLKLAPREFFLRFHKGTAAQLPLAVNLVAMKSQIIGVVHESPGLAHVVVRNSQQVANFEHTKMTVLTLKQSGESWRLVLSDDLKVLALTFQLSFNANNVQEANATAEALPEE